MTVLAPISAGVSDLPGLIDRAASMLAGAKSAAEVLEAREYAGHRTGSDACGITGCAAG